MANNRSSASGGGGKLLAIVLLLAAAAALLVHFHVFRLPWQKENTVKTTEESVLYMPDPGDIETDETTGRSYVKNIILIFFKPGTSDEDMQAAVDAVGGEVAGSLPAIDQLQVRVSADDAEELSALCRELEERDCVAFASFDEARVTSGDMIPNDPWGTEFGRAISWEPGKPVDANWWVNATDAMLAWDDAVDFDEISIGIVDSGFDTEHEDLGNLHFYTGNNSPDDHGTHVAGIIGAQHDNGCGISGMVPNCKLLTADWTLTSEQLEELEAQGGQWVTTNQILGQTVMLIENGAKVVNLSAGCTKQMRGTSRDFNPDGRLASMFLCGLLERGYDFVVVQSAGNGNSDQISVDAANNGFYSSITSENSVTASGVSAEDIIARIIVVGAAQMDGNGGFSQAYWSNAGPRVDLCAPGVEIYSTLAGDSYGYYEGTSMAAPIVSGTAAMVWAANPDLTGSEVKRIVCENTKHTAYPVRTAAHEFSDVYPLVNARLAVDAALEAKGVSVGKNPEELYASVLAEYRDSADELRTNHTVTAAGSRRVYLNADTREQVYYAFHDIDGNGVPELLIGAPVYQTNQSLQIIDIFGLNGETPVSLFKPMKNEYYYLSTGLYPMFHEGEIPTFSRIFADGTICARLGVDEEVATYVRTRLASDGHTLMTLQGLFANYTYLNPATPEEPSEAYYAYSENCENPNMDYDDFIINCLELYGAPFLQSEPYGVQNDYDDWTVRYCSQNGAMISPEWKPLLD